MEVWVLVAPFRGTMGALREGKTEEEQCLQQNAYRMVNDAFSVSFALTTQYAFC
jgi:hypothetical protein